MDIVRFLALAFVDVLRQNCTEIVGPPQNGNRTESVRCPLRSSGAKWSSVFFSCTIKRLYECETVMAALMACSLLMACLNCKQKCAALCLSSGISSMIEIIVRAQRYVRVR